MPRRSKRKLIELQSETAAVDPKTSLREREEAGTKKKRRINSRRTRHKSDVSSETTKSRKTKRTSFTSSELTARLDNDNGVKNEDHELHSQPRHRKRRLSETKDRSPVIRSSTKTKQRRRMTDGYLETVKKTPPLDHTDEEKDKIEDSSDDSSSSVQVESPHAGRKARASHKVKNKKRRKRKSLLHDSEDEEIAKKTGISLSYHSDTDADIINDSSSDNSLCSDPKINESLSKIPTTMKNSHFVSPLKKNASKFRAPNTPIQSHSIVNNEVFASSSVQSATPLINDNLVVNQAMSPPMTHPLYDEKTPILRPRVRNVRSPSDSPIQQRVRNLEQIHNRETGRKVSIRHRNSPKRREKMNDSSAESISTLKWISFPSFDSILKNIAQFARNILFTLLCAIVILVIVRTLISHSNTVTAVFTQLWLVSKNGASMAAKMIQSRKPYCDSGVIIFNSDESTCIQCPSNAQCSNGVVHCDIDDAMVFDHDKGECIRDHLKVSELLSEIELKSYAFLTQVSGDFQCNNVLRYVRHSDRNDESELEEWLKSELYRLWEKSKQSRQRFRGIMDDGRRLSQTPWVTLEYLKSVLMDELNIAANSWAFDDSWDCFIRNASRNSFTRNNALDSAGIYADSRHKQWPYSRLKYHTTLLSFRSRDAYRPLKCHLTMLVAFNFTRILCTLSTVCLISYLLYSWRKREFITQKSNDAISAVINHLSLNKGSIIPSNDIRSEILGDFIMSDQTGNTKPNRSTRSSRNRRRSSIGIPTMASESAGDHESKLKIWIIQMKNSIANIMNFLSFILQCKCCFIHEYWMNDPKIKTIIWQNVEEAMQRKSTVQVSLRRIAGADRVCWKLSL